MEHSASGPSWGSQIQTDTNTSQPASQAEVLFLYFYLSGQQFRGLLWSKNIILTFNSSYHRNKSDHISVPKRLLFFHYYIFYLIWTNKKMLKINFRSEGRIRRLSMSTFRDRNINIYFPSEIYIYLPLYIYLTFSIQVVFLQTCIHWTLSSLPDCLSRWTIHAKHTTWTNFKLRLRLLINQQYVCQVLLLNCT